MRIQRDLDSLSEWSEKWLLKINPAKYKIMHVSHNINTKYFMKDEMNGLRYRLCQEIHLSNVFNVKMGGSPIGRA